MKHVVDEKPESFTTIRVHSEFAHWLKFEAARVNESMIEFLERRFPGTPKKIVALLDKR